MVLTLYVDPLSQPCRALMFFMRDAKIPHEEKIVQLRKGEHKSPDFEKVNAKMQVPAITDGEFVLTETVAIFRYLCATRKVPERWYPKDPQARARVDEFLGWLPFGLRKAGSELFINSALRPIFMKLPVDEAVVEEKLTALHGVVDTMEKFYLCGDHPFLSESDHVTFADVWGACEMAQPLSVGFDMRGKHPRVAEWHDRVRAEISEYDVITKEVNDVGATYKPPSS